MDNLNEELNRTKELMGLLYEQGSGSNAPESFTGSGKSCAAGYMWSEEEGDCVRMDIREVMRNSRELHDLEDELRNDNTMEVMIKKTIEGLYRWQQSRKSEDLKDVKVYDVWRREVKDKLENDIRKYRKDVTNRFINSEAVTKVLSVIDEKTRELTIKEFIQKHQWVKPYILKKVEQDIINYIKHHIEEKDGVEKFMRRWGNKQKPYFDIRNTKQMLERAIENNL
jgi:hypothetical protein|tara:strand:+ start:371 stop:1045 length:675 start_codon:yes stop_codon:yes gene_type:complete